MKPGDDDMEPFLRSDFQVNQIVLACYVGKGKGMTVHHNRPSHGLAFHMDGIKEYAFQNGKTLTVNKYDLIYLPKYSDYEVSSRVEGDCYAINFDTPLDCVFDPFVYRVKNTSGMLGFFKSAKTVWEAKKEGYLLKCKADLYNIIYTMQQEYFLNYVSKSKRDIILPALEYIHEHYTTQPLSIAALSQLCSITPEYFRTIFKSIYGISPKGYINNLKISRAKELLSSGLYSVTEAALLSGYTDMSYFSREFKKATGVTPQKYT